MSIRDKMEDIFYPDTMPHVDIRDRRWAISKLKQLIKSNIKVTGNYAHIDFSDELKEWLKE